MNKSIIYIWLFTLVCVFVQPMMVYNELPDTIASKFDGSGQPIEYSTKNEFLILWVGIAVFVNGIMWGISNLVWKWMPNSVNVPNKNYWFATEARKKQAQEKLSMGLALIATVCNLLFLAIFQATYRFSLDGKLPFNLLWLIVGFGVVMLGVMIYFISSFRIPQQTGFNPQIR